MRIGFVGAGKVGFTFGRYIAERGNSLCGILSDGEKLSVSGYYSAHMESAEEAASFTDTVTYDSLAIELFSYISHSSGWKYI